MTIKVGDYIFRHDPNRRVYAQDENGRSIGGPIYREQFYPETITGETTQSWLVASGWLMHKVNKKTMRSAGKNGYVGYRYLTKEGVEDDIWRHENQHRLGEAVGRSNIPVSTLKTIADILTSNGLEP